MSRKRNKRKSEHKLYHTALEESEGLSSQSLVCMTEWMCVHFAG